MATDDRPPAARLVFRKMALGLAVVLFILAAVFQFVAPEQGWFGPAIRLAVGFVMGTIGATGNWPARALRRSRGGGGFAWNTSSGSNT